MRLRLMLALSLSIISPLVLLACCVAGEPTVRLATFDVDATPPPGSPVAYARVASVDDPLHAKGIVLLPGDAQPIVLCAFDWIGIANGGQDWLRQHLADAAGTIGERVVVHGVHQHDGPRCDMTAIELLGDPERIAPHFDIEFLNRVKSELQKAVQRAISDAQPVTHIGIGKAQVEKVASNRRLLGADGKVAKMRFSSCRDAAAVAAPEGVIDPWVRLVSWWNEDQPLACLAYYTTHPMSHYGEGNVSADFVGLAREERQQQTGAIHIYFTGAAGNVAAGKYNNGDPQMRPVLAGRLAAGMRKAWTETSKTEICAEDIHWKTTPVQLPVASHLNAGQLQATLDSAESSDDDRLAAASNLAWLTRCQAGISINLCALRVGPALIIHMPGELFVEYALAAQEMRPTDFVCVAAYGDYGPGYIGTKKAYGEGGYETSARASRVSAEVESVLLDGLQVISH